MKSPIFLPALVIVTLVAFGDSPPLPAAEEVVISEFLADNASGILDEDGEESDWVELENRGDLAADLSGWHLSDSVDDLKLWTFPDGVRIEPGAFLVLFASGKDRTSAAGELHTNFRLNSDGELLVLVQPDARTIEHGYVPGYPEQRADISFGILPAAVDPSQSGRYFREPTPGDVVAGAGQVGFVSDTRFSVDRGFFNEAFEVQVTTDTPGVEIRYTTDGSAPSAVHGSLYRGPIRIDSTTVLRAVASKSQHFSTNVDSQTYLFLTDVIDQPLMRRESVTTHRSAIEDALLSLPTLSIALSDEDFQNLQIQEAVEGTKKELPASVEWIDPELGGRFQINCAIEGHSWPATRFPKRAFRLKFKREFGPSRLNFPIFSDTPWNPGTATDSFDRLILRRESWDSDEAVARDEWTRASQVALSGVGSHGTYAHVYINGNYWGPYDICERPDVWFGASYLGGETEDWFSTNHGIERGGNHLSGDNSRFDRMVGLAGEKDLENPEKYAAFTGLLDIDRFSDYVMIYWYAGVADGMDNNWYALQKTEPAEGLRFFLWDTSACFREGLGGVGPPGNNGAWVPPFFFDGSYAQTTIVKSWQALRDNPDFRIAFADRIYKQCFNDGPLTGENSIERWRAITGFIEEAMIGEEARWGRGEWFRERDWRPDILAVENRMSDNVERFVTALRERDLFASPPELSQHGGVISPGFTVEVATSSVPVYFTLDGTDPRLSGGAVAPTAQELDLAAISPIGPDSALRLHVPTSDSPGLDWTAVEFDDSGWTDGSLGVGFDATDRYEPFIRSDVGELMIGVNATIYVRIPFRIEGEVPPILFLLVRYDDGFVAYLNGERVLDRNPPVTPGSRARASGTNDGANLEKIDVSAWRDQFLSGDNVLAVQVMNQLSRNGDLLFQAELQAFNTGQLTLSGDTQVRMRSLSGGTWSALNSADFFLDRGMDLRVTEVLYHPWRPETAEDFNDEDFEFIELKNISQASTLDLSEYRITGGIDFKFSTGTIASLDPGAVVLVVNDLEAFRSIHDTASMRIAGEYDGRLDNAGDSVRVEGPMGTVVHEFTYEESWHPLTDGDGHSLEVIDPDAELSAWQEASGWRASAKPGGTPGMADIVASGGLQRIGDLNQDSRLNIADAHALLRSIFTTRDSTIPCGASINDPGNRALMDLDGDRAVNLADASYLLRYLFLRGPEPASGTGCVAVVGCSDLCLP